MTSVEAKGAFAAAGDLAPGFKSAGGDVTVTRGNESNDNRF